MQSLLVGWVIAIFTFGVLGSVQNSTGSAGQLLKFTGNVTTGTKADLMAIIASGNHENHTAFWEIGTSHVVDLTLFRTSPRIGKRVSPCNSYNNFRATQVQQMWNSYSPVSACLDTGFDPSGGYPEISWTFEIEQQTGISISLNIADLINLSGGYSATSSYSVSDSYACNVPGNSIGQIFARQYVNWAWIEEQTCQVCDGTKCSAWTGIGAASAPVRGIYEVGCSVGSDKVNCLACHDCVIYS